MRTKTSVGRDFQDQLLSRLMESRQITTIYLRNRMSLRGRVLRFDPYVVLLDPLDGTPPQLVYKSAMVSISGPRRMPGPDNGSGGPARARRPEGGSARSYGGPRPDSRSDVRPYGDSRPYEERRPYGDRHSPDGHRPYGAPRPAEAVGRGPSSENSGE